MTRKNKYYNPLYLKRVEMIRKRIIENLYWNEVTTIKEAILKTNKELGI